MKLIFTIESIVILVLRMSTDGHLSHRPTDVVNDEDVRDNNNGDRNHPESDKDGDDEWVSCRIIWEVIKAATCQVALRSIFTNTKERQDRKGCRIDPDKENEPIDPSAVAKTTPALFRLMVAIGKGRLITQHLRYKNIESCFHSTKNSSSDLNRLSVVPYGNYPSVSGIIMQGGN